MLGDRRIRRIRSGMYMDHGLPWLIGRGTPSEVSSEYTEWRYTGGGEKDRVAIPNMVKF